MARHPADPEPHDPTGPGAALDRRTLLRGGTVALGAMTAAALGACSQDGPTVEGGAPQTRLSLTGVFPRDVPYVVAGAPTRLAFEVRDRAGRAVAPTGPVVMTVAVDDEQVGTQATATAHADGVRRPYLPATLTFPEPGTYEVVAEVDRERLRVEVQAYPRDEVGTPQIGEQLPPVETPTVARPLLVDPVCSRVPGCGLHEKNLSNVVGRGRPVAVVSASPLYPGDDGSAEFLELVVAEARRFPGTTFIHCETYRNPKDVRSLADAAPGPIAEAYRLRWAPALFVADAAGLVVARADKVVDRTELRQLLSTAG